MNENLIVGLNWLGAITGLGTLLYSIANILLAQRRAAGLQTGVASQALKTPYLMIATVIFIALGVILWKPLPFQPAERLRLGMMLIGIIIMLPSLALYVWGLRTLGTNFNASSGFGVRLQQAHKLVVSGPFTYLRHPMYLAVILSCWGGLLLYHTWTMLICAVMMFGLVYRSRKEEEALAQAFGTEWEKYKQAVPGWWPRWGSLPRKHIH